MKWQTREEKPEEGSTGHRFITLKSGRVVSFLDAQREAEDHLASLYRWELRMEKLADVKDKDLNEWYWEQVEWFIDKVDALVGYSRDEIKKHNTRKSKEERIAALRNVTGRSPEEAAAFLAKADQLEKEL